MELSIKHLGAGYIVVQYYLYSPKVKVKVSVTETYEDGSSVVVSTKEELREGEKNLCEDCYIFTIKQYELMLHNFSLASCSLTPKGLARYCQAYGNGTSWYKQPAATARKMAQAGVQLPRSLFGLYSKILGEC